MINKWPVSYHPTYFLFGSDYTILYRWCEWGGYEIHVNAKSPVRDTCLELINSVGGIWWTTIDTDNQRAINLALKCGFCFYCEKSGIDGFNGKMYKMNIYKRG